MKAGEKKERQKKRHAELLMRELTRTERKKAAGVVTGLSFMSLIFFEGLFFSSIAFLFSLNCLFKNRMGWM